MTKERIGQLLTKWWLSDITDDEFNELQIELFKRVKEYYLSNLSHSLWVGNECKFIKVFPNTHNEIICSIGTAEGEQKSKPMNVALYEQYAV